jgi:hypothetical protein
VLYDGATTVSSTTVTAASASFAVSDIGRPIGGVGIPAGSTIVSRTSATSIVISAAATATGTNVKLSVGHTWVELWQGQAADAERVPLHVPFGVWAGYPNADCTGAPSYARVGLRGATVPDDLPMYGLQLVVWYGA